MDNRNFQMDNQWNIIHYPEKPKGFGVLIIGDERHFVDEHNSFWLQNEGKLEIINKLKEAGYTIFSSNLFGCHWGSDHAVELAERLYHHVIRNEILNNKIHIIAEGMGALAALKLLRKIPGRVRSLVVINPILSLQLHIEHEKEHKFFFKKLTKELESAYQCSLNEIEDRLNNETGYITLQFGIPIKMIHVLSGGRAYNQAKLYHQILKQEIDKKVFDASFILPEKKQQLGSMLVKFLSSSEKDL
jgi:hypothetical protein